MLISFRNYFLMEERKSGGNNVALYRAETSGRTRYPSGEFWTEMMSLAKYYQKKGTSKNRVIVQATEIPKNPFDVSKPIKGKRLDDLQIQFLKFMRNKYPSVSIEDEPYMYEVLFNTETDFVYPKAYDVEFLKSLGYDSVYFEKEGGQTVKTWFVFEPLRREPLY